MTNANINPAILQWARHRLNLTEAQIAQKVGLRHKAHRVKAWEAGDQLPTFRQAQNLARALKIPFGYLFLAEPPATTLPIADFRTLPEAEQGKFSPELEDVLNDALRKRDWLRERRIQEGQPKFPYIGRFPVHADPEKISADIRQTLDLPVPPARDAKSWDDHFRFLVRKVEQAGIMVLQSGYAGSNTRRTLSVKEFRGFTLVDPYAPLIFLNGKDTVNGKIFTLAHELGHLWTGTSGISNPMITLPEKETPEVERLCNQIAAELLVPAQLIAQYWQRYPIDFDLYNFLAKKFRVSVFVILLRGFELDLLPYHDFQQAYTQASDKLAEALANQKKSSGGNFYLSFPTRHSRLFVGEIAEAMREGSLLHKEASGLLNTKPTTLENALVDF